MSCSRGFATPGTRAGFCGCPRASGKDESIPHDWEGSGFQRPALHRIMGFQELLLEHGIRATVRWSKGEDIGAACGQLKETVEV